ncbi:hypothetical protein M446_0799 [Methylobacterium sp. 4-46]|nr:hypothetical protein M446_0799 [Methylobacterium sp. 4-46]
MSANDHRLDLLTDLAEIGCFVSWPPRRVQHRALSGDLLTFKVGHHTCAHRSTPREWAACTERGPCRPSPDPQCRLMPVI